MLTSREEDILNYLIQGYTNKEIAKILYISTHTAKAHVAAIMRKLSAKNRTEIAYLVGKYNLI